MGTTREELLKLIDQRVAGLNIPSEPALLYDPIAYILEDGGKRMRPLLALLAAQVYDQDNGVERAMNSAMAVEVFHNFTLLHDDIMDKSQMRRSRETVHCKWNENVAILSGDAMLILAYQILADQPDGVDLGLLMNIFSRSAMEVCQGQQMDMDFETQDNVEIWDYLQMIRLKTAVLMAGALKLGAIVGGASKKQADAMYEFGINLGLAFQIQDDYLDTFGTAETFGKKIGGDIEVGKKTFLYLTAVSRASLEQRAELDRMDDMSTRLERVREIYRDLKVDEIAQSVIKGYFEQAIQGLKDCHGDLSRVEPLAEYARVLLRRDR